MATTDGVLTLAPHFVAQGLIDGAVEQGMAPASVRSEYDHAGVEAMKKIPKPPFPSDSFLDWMKAAMHRWESPR